MNEFEMTYRQLRDEGQPGWARSMHERSCRSARERLDHMAAIGQLPAIGSCALELGCGNGVVMFSLAELGFEAYGIDISPTAVEWAKERAVASGLRCHVVCGTVTRMTDFHDGQFKLVCDGACLHCLIGSDRAAALWEVNRILALGGIFLLSSMCGAPKKLQNGQTYDPVNELILFDGVPARTIRSRESLEQEVKSAGFAIVESYVNENPWWDHLSLLARKVE